MLERLQGTICVLTLLGWPSQEIETEPRNGAKWSESRGGGAAGLEMKRKYFEMTDCLLLGIGTLFRSLDNKL